MLAHDLAVAVDGVFLLRIEDIDQSRARAEWEQQIYDDLHWLGLTWPEPVLRQSDNLAAYDAALDTLWARGLLYRCDCNRRDVEAAATAPQEGAPLIGPDGLVYPGTCRRKHPRIGPRPRGAALRLDMSAALGTTHKDMTFRDNADQPRIRNVQPQTTITHIGDVVLARRDMGTSYHLSVVVDDAAQHITDVVRGKDLSDATDIHVILQHLLGLPTPIYHHHRLIRDDTGKRLAKRDDARAISKYRGDGASPDDIRAMLGLPVKPA